MIEVALNCPFCGQPPTLGDVSGCITARCSNNRCFMYRSGDSTIIFPIEYWNERDQTAFLQFCSSLDREHTEKMKALKLLIIFESTIDFLLEFIKNAGLDLPKDVLAQWQEYKESKSL